MNNPYYVQPKTGQALTGLANALSRGVLQDRERNAAAEVNAKNEQIKNKATQLMDANDIAGLSKFFVMHPEIGKQVQASMKFKDDESKANAVDVSGGIIAGGNADELLTKRADWLDANGMDSTQTRSRIGKSPKTQLKFAQMNFASNATPEQHAGLRQMREANKDLNKPYQQGTGDMAGYAFNPNDGSFNLDEKVSVALSDKAAQAALKGIEVGLKDRQGINKDVTALIKGSSDIHSAAKSMQKLKASSSPASQLAAIFKFMKALDPTSVVREGEQQMARNTGGPADYLVGVARQLQGEGSLPPKVFADMVQTSVDMADSAVDSSGVEITNYLDTYENTLPDSFKQKLMKRIPQRITEKVEEVATPQGTETAVQVSAPEVGFTEGGFTFMGGDPSIKENWKAN